MALLDAMVTLENSVVLAELVFNETAPPLVLSVVAPPEEIKERFWLEVGVKAIEPPVVTDRVTDEEPGSTTTRSFAPPPELKNKLALELVAESETAEPNIKPGEEKVVLLAPWKV